MNTVLCPQYHCRHISLLQRLFCLGSLLVLALRLPAAELLRNGSFAGGLNAWKINPALSDWSPWQSGAVSLHPPGYGFTGIVLYQNLNVPSVAGKTLTVTASLQKAYAPSGRTVAVYVDYATAAGQIKRLTVLNPDNAWFQSDYTNMTADFTLPAEAAKLVRLSLAKLISGDFSTTNVSLSGSGLTAGNVPAITSISTAAGPYYSTTNSGLLTLWGHDFGAATGQVFIGTSPAGAVGQSIGAPAAQVVSWNNTQAVVSVVEPMCSGGIYLLADSVESDGDFSFTLLSPNFTVDVVNPNITVVRGQTATVLLKVVFLNGFQTAGGVSFMMTTPSYAPPSSPPLFRSGGYSIDLDTTSLTNGTYAGMVQSLSETYARFTPFTLNVTSITNINFYTNSGLSNVTISSFVVTNQNEFTYNFSYQLLDNTGQPYGASAAGSPSPSPVTVTSDNPAVVSVATGNFGPRYFAASDGLAHLTFATPDGCSNSLAVTVSLGTGPRFTVGSILPTIADNSGLSTNTIYWQGTADPTWIGYEGSAGFSFDNRVGDYDMHSVTWTFGVPAGTPPGNYLLYSTIGDGSLVPKSVVTLTVVNDATRGQVAGAIEVIDASGNPMMQEINGNLEIYDAGTGLGAVTNMIANFNTSTYSVGYLRPGSYRIRFVPMNTSMAPQWYPNATNFAQAATVSVAAGQTATNVNFYLAPVCAPPASLLLPGPVVHHADVPCGDWDFCLPSTVSGVVYFLEFKDSLDDPAWTIAQTITGDGGPRTLVDHASSSAHRFYRLRMVVP